MTVLYDNATSAQDSGTHGVVGGTHTPVSSSPSGVIGMLVVYNGEYAMPTPTGTYGGVSFGTANCIIQGPVGTTKDHGSGPENGNYWQVMLFGIANPPPGPQAFSFTFGGSLDVYPIAGVITVTGSDLTNIFRSTGVTGSGTGTPGLVIPSAAGDLIVDVMGCGQAWTGGNAGGFDGNAITNLTASPNIRRWFETMGNPSGAGSSIAATGSSMTTAWAKTGASGAYWLGCGASVKAAAGGGGGGATGWNRVKVGGGGFTLKMSASDDGVSRVITSDAGGALLSTSGGDWQQLMTSLRLPNNGEWGPNGRQEGSWACGVAPNDNQRIYLVAGAAPQTGYTRTFLYKSTDGGSTFTQTAFAGVPWCAPNDGYDERKFCGPRIAVDPANHDVLVFAMFGSTADFSWSTGAHTYINYQVVNGGVAAGISISFTGPPTGMTAGTVYKTGATTGTAPFFQTEILTSAGAAISSSGSGSGGQYLVIQETYYSADAGTTCTVLPNVPKGTQIGADRGVCFDRSSTVTGGKTQGIYVFNQGNGLYHSTNGGSSFALVTSSPVGCESGKCARDGKYYIANSTNEGTKGVYRYDGSWTTISQPNTRWGQTAAQIAVAETAAQNVTHISVLTGGGVLSVSTDNGATWPNGEQLHTFNSPTGQPGWLSTCKEDFASSGDISFDPLVADKAWWCEGIGVWYATTYATGFQGNVSWSCFSAGIEELVGQQIVALPNGNVMMGCQDRGIFCLTDVTQYPTHQAYNEATSLNDGSSIDWASSSTSTVVAIVAAHQFESVKSSSNGAYGSYSLLSIFPGHGAWNYTNSNSGGDIAASSATVWLADMAGTGATVFTTKDGGSTWSEIPVSGANGWNNGMLGYGSYNGWFDGGIFLWRQHIIADRVTANRFYIQNAQTIANGGGIYRVDVNPSTGLATCTRMTTAYSNDSGPSAYNLIMVAVPGYADNFFITSGEGQSNSVGSGTYGLRWSPNGGTNMYQIANTTETFCVGVGKIATGKNYPTIFFVGYLSGVFGVWMGVGNLSDWQAGSNTGSTVTWTNLGLPLGNLSLIHSISGDLNIEGQCYVTTPTNGSFYYGAGGAIIPPPDPGIDTRKLYRMGR